MALSAGDLLFVGFDADNEDFDEPVATVGIDVGEILIFAEDEDFLEWSSDYDALFHSGIGRTRVKDQLLQSVRVESNWISAGPGQSANKTQDNSNRISTNPNATELPMFERPSSRQPSSIAQAIASKWLGIQS